MAEQTARFMAKKQKEGERVLNDPRPGVASSKAASRAESLWRNYLGQAIGHSNNLLIEGHCPSCGPIC